MRQIPKPFEKYRHFKGMLYQILNLAKDSETMDDVVVYQALYGNYQVYVRPLEMFMSEVDKNKYPEVQATYRFEKVTDSTATVNDLNESQVEIKDEKNESLNHSGMVEEKPELEENVSEEPVTCEKAQEADVEYTIDPAVLEFLDADNYGEKLNILTSLKYRITDDMITTMAVASDLEVEEGPVEVRYEQLKNCLLTKEKYECVRMR
ncbi:MAG: DUF1653 domain-containing protein [Lachnospiraceae bacterium]|nr:DUF1653 domain-containing protein [Lachnospiraceae bacterium]